MRWRGYAIAVVAFLLVGGGAVALGTRSGDPAPSPSLEPSEPAVPVIVPGRPGESATVVPSDQLEIPDGARYNTWDVWFIRMMIPHHTQALELAALVPDRAGSPQIHALAERIDLAQAVELDVLRAWLDARGLAGSDPAGSDPDHDHGQMPGMQSPEAIGALAATTGDAFDRRFVEMMTDHHQGAIDMAVEVLRLGVDERVSELATSIAAEQSAEINRMREL